MTPPGPKSPRARAIFNGLYGSVTYPFVKTAYENDAAFRQEVDNYLIPDGINLLVSMRLDDLRAFIDGWGGTSFPAFLNTIKTHTGSVGPPPARGVLTPVEKDEIRSSRAWRDLVQRKVSDPAQQGQVKAELGIPA